MASSGVAHGSARSVSERLKAATDELQKLEQLVVSGDCAPRVLTEFRGAVDSIRQTAWAVQQWTELQSQNRDPYSVLGLLSEERIDSVTLLKARPHDQCTKLAEAWTYLKEQLSILGLRCHFDPAGMHG